MKSEAVRKSRGALWGGRANVGSRSLWQEKDGEGSGTALRKQPPGKVLLKSFSAAFNELRGPSHRSEICSLARFCGSGLRNMVACPWAPACGLACGLSAHGVRFCPVHCSDTKDREGGGVRLGLLSLRSQHSSPCV